MMSTFGDIGHGTVGGSTTVDKLRIRKFTLSENGSVSKLSIYCDGSGSGTGSQVVKGVIYADSSGTPGAIVGGLTNEATVTDGQAAGEVDLTYASPVALSAGDYWLGAWFGANTNTIRWYNDGTTGATVRYWDDDYDAPPPADPYSSGSSSTTKYAIQATYTASGWTGPYYYKDSYNLSELTGGLT